MNYQKIYDSIIARAISEDRHKIANKNCKGYVYYEEHHIKPRCIGGLDTKENLVLLTGREHFLCHKLLAYIYDKNVKIIYAYLLMTKNPYGLYNVSSRDYARAKQMYRELPSSEKTKKRRLEMWYEINCNEDAINEYLDSLKHVHYSPDFDRSIHISF